MEATGAIVSWFVLAAEFYRFIYMTKQTEEEVNAVFNVGRFAAECLLYMLLELKNNPSWKYPPRSLVTLYVPSAYSQK